MPIIGSILSLLVAILYSIRSSFLKDLKVHYISKSQTNFLLRLISFPLILILAIATKTNLLYLNNHIILIYLIALLLNLVLGLYQVYIYQKHNFSDVEVQYFFLVFFNIMAGFLIFHETLSYYKMAGIGMIILSFLILFIYQNLKHHKSILTSEIVLMYLLMTTVDITNKKAILLTSPMYYSVHMTLLLTIGFLAISHFKNGRHTKLYDFSNRKSNLLLFLLGTISSGTVVMITFAYSIVPLAILTTLISVRVYISLWLAKKKYLEEGLGIKLVATTFAFIGTAILFL